MITLTNLRKKQQNGYRGAGFGRGQDSRTPRKGSATPRNGSRTPRKRFATTRGPSELFGNASRHREDLPNSSETLRDDARTFRTLRKRFATTQGPSELFGNASRHREMVPAHRGRAFLLNSLCPSGISPFKRGRKIEKQTIPAPPSEGGAPRRGEGVQNSDAAPLPMESFRKRGPKISRDTYIRE